MPIPSAGFPGATAGSSPVIYPTGSSGNSLQSTGFIPEIWSGKLVEKFYASTVLAAISNTDYEGEIKNKGDRVKIRTKPTITIRNYQSDGLLGLDRPTGGAVELYIGNGKYFSLILDDVMEIQSDLNVLSMWSDDAAQQLKITVDSDVLDGIVNQMAAANRGTAAGVITGNINLGVKGTPLSVVSKNPGVGDIELLDVLMRMGQVLDEQNIPEIGRWGCDAVVGRTHDQAVRTPAGIPVRRQRLDAAERPARYGGSVHDLHLEPAAEQQHRQRQLQRWRVADLRRPRPRPDLCLADQQGGDASLRTDLRPNPARPAGLWLSGRRRQGAGPGPGDPEQLRAVNETLRPPELTLRGFSFVGQPCRLRSKPSRTTSMTRERSSRIRSSHIAMMTLVL